MKWKATYGHDDVLTFMVGKKVERIMEAEELRDLPTDYTFCDSEKSGVILSDGTAIAIAYDPGSPGYSEYTPGSDARMELFTGTL